MNLCIPRYHKYSYFFDQPIFFANEANYAGLLIAESLALWLYYTSMFKYFGSAVWDQGLLLGWFNMVYLHGKNSYFFTVVIALVVGWLMLVKWFHAFLMVYCIFRNLTLDEVMNPHWYPYLFRPQEADEDKFEFHNPDSVGFFSNCLSFIRQALNTDSQLD